MYETTPLKINTTCCIRFTLGLAQKIQKQIMYLLSCKLRLAVNALASPLLNEHIIHIESSKIVFVCAHGDGEFPVSTYGM